MDLDEVRAELAKADSWLTELWGKCYARAVNQIKGNWADSVVMTRRRELATKYANEELKGFSVKVDIKCLKKH